MYLITFFWVTDTRCLHFCILGSRYVRPHSPETLKSVSLVKIQKISVPKSLNLDIPQLQC